MASLGTNKYGLTLLLWCLGSACADEVDSSAADERAPSTVVNDATKDVDAGATLPASGQNSAAPDASADGALLDAGKDATQDASNDVRDSGGDASKTSEAGTTTTLEATIIVKSGDVFDGKNQRFKAGSALGDGSQSESQKPMFRLEDGATLRNVVLGAPAADGIHAYGDATLTNIVWEDVGEDALTIKESGTVSLAGGSAQDGSDKVFQINAASTFKLSDFKARNAGKLIRQNGGTTFKVEVFIDRCDIAQMKESIFRTDSKVSTVSMTNSRYSQIGKELFMGVAPENISQSNNTEY